MIVNIFRIANRAGDAHSCRVRLQQGYIRQDDITPDYYSLEHFQFSAGMVWQPAENCREKSNFKTKSPSNREIVWSGTII